LPSSIRKSNKLFGEKMSDIKADVLIVRNRRDWKISARKNEVKCENCGNICFWVTILKNKIKIQCINCYEFLTVSGSGITAGIKKLPAGAKNLPAKKLKP